MDNQLKATIKTVASLAGVSAMTVSRVTNNSPLVKENTRQRVLKAIEELNYHPNIFASNFPSRGKIRAIGLVIKNFAFDYFLSVDYFAELLSGIQQAVGENGFDLIIYNLNPFDNKDCDISKWFHSGMVQGFVMIVPQNDDPVVKQLLSENIPFVILGCHKGFEHLNYVDVENENGGYLAAKHLIDLKHEKIALIQGPADRSDSCEREDGFRRALQDTNVPLNKDYIVRGNFTEKSGFDAAKLLLENQQAPTAIFAANDLMAIGAIKAIQQKGLTVPRDISVVGFDDIKPALENTPALSTIHQPIKEIGSLGAKYLMTESDQKNEQVKMSLPVSLIERESSAIRLV